MAGGIRGHIGSRFDGAAGLTHSTSTPIPIDDEQTRLGLPFQVKLNEYISKAAAAQAKPGLPRGFWIRNDE